MQFSGALPFEQSAPKGPAGPDAKQTAKDPSAGTVRERLLALFKEDFDIQLADNPEFATQAGFHQYDDELQDLSPAAFERRQQHALEVCEALRHLLKEAEEAPSGGGLSEREKLYAKLLLDAAEGEAQAIELGCHLMPLNSIGVGGVHENFLELLEWMRFEGEEDVKLFLGRLMAFPDQVASFRDLLAYGSGPRGIAASRSMMRRVPARLEELINGDLAELRAPLKGKDFVSKELEEQLSQAIQNCFRASLESLHLFLTEFYADRVRPEPGILALKKGSEIYAACLRFHTTTRKSAKEIHELGLKEVARIEQRMQKEVFAVVGFEGNAEEFASSLKSDRAFFYDSEEALLQGYRELVARITAELPRFFSKLPKAELEVVPKRSGPAAYYFAGTPDGSRPGRFYVNVSRLEERPKYEMAALALHEGVPGHHLQGALALENEEIPDFLRYIEDRRYEFAPARRPLYTGYLEGWALYCERLGEEMGMYRTPHELFGRLSMEMMRAVRLVVDTGIHDQGWSVEKAVEYMRQKTGMAQTECEEECHRYAAWPGQACAYKVGQLAIEELREKAESALASSFSLPAFHELLLGSGPLPLDVLSVKLDEWVAAQSAKN